MCSGVGASGAAPDAASFRDRRSPILQGVDAIADAPVHISRRRPSALAFVVQTPQFQRVRAEADDLRRFGFGQQDAVGQLVEPFADVALARFRHVAARRRRAARGVYFRVGLDLTTAPIRPNLAKAEAVRSASSAPVRRSAISIRFPVTCPWWSLGRAGGVRYCHTRSH